MKRLFRLLALFLVLLTPTWAMAGKTILQLTEDTSPTTDDMIETVNAPAGTPGSRKASLGNVLGLAVSDTPYAASWDGITTIAPSKNAVYDYIELLSLTGDLGDMLKANYDGNNDGKIDASAVADLSATYLIDADIGSIAQAYDADLTYLAGFTPTANVKTVLNAADFAAIRTALGLTIGTNVQAWDAQLDTWATVTPSANGQSLVSAADYSAMRTALSLVPGTHVQAYDADLATLATPTAWRMYYSNATSVQTAFVVGAAGQPLVGYGAAVAPAFGDMDPDYLIGDTVNDDKVDAGLIADLSSTYEIVDASIMRNVVQDTTPQLGGNLDTHSNWIEPTSTYGMRTKTTTTAHYYALQAYDVDLDAYVDVIRFINGNTPEAQLQAGTVLSGLGSQSIKNGDTSGAYLDLYEKSSNGTNYVRLRAEDNLPQTRLITSMQTRELTIPEPDKQQLILDAWPIFRVDAAAFPFGITVIQCNITLSADAAYVAVFEEWTGDPPAQTADIETVTTGAGDSYMEDVTPANPLVEADNYVYVDLPTTDVPMLNVQVVFVANAS